MRPRGRRRRDAITPRAIGSARRGQPMLTAGGVVPKAVQYLPDTLRILMTSGLLPAALIAIVLNLLLPEELSEEATEEVSGGLASQEGIPPETPRH